MKRSHIFANLVIYAVVAAFFAGGVLFVSGGSLWDRYPTPYLTAAAAFLSGVVIGLPAIIYFWSKRLKKRYRTELLYLIQGVLAFTLILNALGALSWYLSLLGYDTFVHFFNPFMGVIMLYVLLHAWRGVRGGSFVATWKHATAAIIGVAALAVVWEFYELLSDPLFGVQQFGQPGEPLDTLYDSIANVAGLVVGGAVVWLRGVPLLERYNNFRR